jgi:hypothetical protein
MVFGNLRTRALNQPKRAAMLTRTLRTRSMDLGYREMKDAPPISEGRIHARSCGARICMDLRRRADVLIELRAENEWGCFST